MVFESCSSLWVRQWDKTVFWYQFYVFVWYGRICVLGSCMGGQCLKFTPCCAPNLCLQQPYILPIFMQGKTGLTCRLKPLSKRQPMHHLCLSLIQFHIQNDKLSALLFEQTSGPPWPFGAGLGEEVLLPESQQLHGWFWRKTGSSSARCLGFGFWAVSLPVQKIPADVGGPYVWFLRCWVVLSEWLTLARSNSSGAEGGRWYASVKPSST